MVFISLLLLGATAMQGATVITGTIQVGREVTANLGSLTGPNIQPWGCVIVSNTNPAVRSGARGGECAKFEITNYSDNSFGAEYRFKELSTGKLMAHGGDWIWFNAEPGDETDRTLFVEEKYRGSSVMRPADSSTRVHADYENGDLNVKNGGEGFLMYYSIAKSD
ncbi:hypothetical protein M413DRAFT_29860 [Hebeloma cylindrosporum]|uniref:Uncharacterized protein n=1 Tax=Hebeloma cylindrosporum TaxID=76867 RepID=A0A0C2YD28_HEBCY|nr:hypothetical protein M413DRAFT_29860 [Hebeloma cylindrosporum h7]